MRPSAYYYSQLAFPPEAVLFNDEPIQLDSSESGLFLARSVPIGIGKISSILLKIPPKICPDTVNISNKLPYFYKIA